MVCAELGSYGPAGTATRFKRVAGERLSRPEPHPWTRLTGTIAANHSAGASAREDLLEGLQGPRVLRLTQPEHRLLAHFGAAVAAGDLAQQRHPFLRREL